MHGKHFGKSEASKFAVLAARAGFGRQVDPTRRRPTAVMTSANEVAGLQSDIAKLRKAVKTPRPLGLKIDASTTEEYTYT